MKVEHYYKPDSKTLREETQVLTRWIDPTIEKLQQENKQLKAKINKVASDLGHELYGHILQNDEVTWNEEYYTDGKLDYRKLLIALLEDVFEILEVDGSKWYDYDRE